MHFSAPASPGLSLARTWCRSGRRTAGGVAVVLAWGGGVAGATAAEFTRLQPLAAPAVVRASEAHPNGHTPLHLTDGDLRTQYISASKGTQTFVEFDFGRVVPLAAFRHHERPSPATIAESEIVCLDDNGTETQRVRIVHAGESSAVTMQAISPAVSVRRVRWQVTKLGGARVGTVGGTEVAFYEAAGAEPQPRGISANAIPLPLAARSAEGLRQTVKIEIDYPYAEPIDAALTFGDVAVPSRQLRAGRQVFDVAVPVSARVRTWPLVVTMAGSRELARRDVEIPPFRELTIYILPHSHVDIGYTEIQTDIEEKQVNNLLAGMELAERTASNPPGARFVWNLENLWPVDLLQQRLGDSAWERFLAAARAGHVALNGMYANTLTGLCRPEELVRVFSFAAQLRASTGLPLDTAMISDVPGYTWGTVPAMAEAGIRYFSPAPNYFDRIGDILVQWENKPFWWVGPSGTDRLLVWVPSRGYALSHIIRRLSPQWLVSYAEELVRTDYPYSVAHIRWAGHGDNGVPDPTICDFVKQWNVAHAWPKFAIGSVREAFQELERKHGRELPEFRGDWTPYWEDGAASSAAETAMNRATSDRLAQAEALWAMLQPRSFPTRDFRDAMRYVHLYGEHTWGASRSVSEPNHRTTLEQWAIKRGYAQTADTLSRDLLGRALSLRATARPVKDAVDVFNTSSWTRTGLVTLPKDMATAGDRVADDTGRPVPAQRNTVGELVFLATDVPAFGSRRYSIGGGRPHADASVRIEATSLANDRLRVALDPRTGAIVELRANGSALNLANPAGGGGLNDYLYFNGDDPRNARRNGPVKIRLKEKGPLFASLVAESEAPGCFTLAREIRLVAGADHVEIENFVDKARVEAASYRAPEGKESVNFSFPFHVPGGQVRLEVPFGVLRPEADQIPGSCKNWLTVNRWADVANDDGGVTWISLDTPLVQVGGLTANLLNSQTNPAVWRQRIEPTQRLDAWVMNNHWGTNYRAYQEGPHTFRFVLRPHRGYDPAAATRLAIAASQPLLPVRARGTPPAGSLLPVFSAPQVIVTGLKPSDDGGAVIMRAWVAAEGGVSAAFAAVDRAAWRVVRSDTSEETGEEIAPTLALPGWGVVTLRLEGR
jgi:hypothetical protein